MSFRARILAPLAALIASACGSPGTAEAPRPALWKVSDPDTTIYLFGTVHMLPASYRWRTAVFDAAAKQADTLVLEIATINDQTASAEIYKQMAVASGLPPILDRVPANKRAALAKAIATAGLKPEQLNGMKSWAAALTLGTMTSGKANGAGDADPANGVDKQLGKLFGEAGKPVIGLETTRQQFGYFDSLPEPAQRQFLLAMADDAETGAAQVRDMVSVWGKGDTKKIAVTFDDELHISRELADKLVRQRNEAWAKWIEARMASTPGTVMVAVGAGHLAGSDSVIALLQKHGLKVKRIQ